MRKTTQQFVDDAVRVHGEVYDYTHSTYVNNATKLTIVCIDHGEFQQTPKNHLGGTGCPICAIADRRRTNNIRYGSNGKPPTDDAKRKKTQTSLERFGTEYASQNLEVRNKIVTTNRAKYGSDRATQNADVLVAREQSNIEKYGVPYPNQQHMMHALSLLTNPIWLVDQYTNNLRTATQIANELNVERTTVLNYLRIHNIPIIQHRSHSAKCTDWLNGIMMVSGDHIMHSLNGGEFKIPHTRMSVDGFCVATNTVYEFYGDYWHGNPIKYSADAINKSKNKTMGQLYAATIRREQKIISLGYNLITMWEAEFDQL